ncbi:hypothetical protein OEZ60_01225 [Defluviimonas sp. WL0024]|uniref:Acyltransferase n=2 Tax=Albidovulum TaxID=205889 RepID=A0ABT3IXM6_9RHOB|nr:MULTISPECIES: hypothetical protein [Defluviimonas]MCU9846626.1 hypothetical protein [Defluviimonas sp. WL0024]MCW3780197.1 hypothetical protein [Defluviimonas salinarum]
MIFFAATLLGALTGWLRATRRGGDRLDKLQYAAVHAIIFAIAGLFVTIAVHRLS